MEVERLKEKREDILNPTMRKVLKIFKNISDFYEVGRGPWQAVINHRKEKENG